MKPQEGDLATKISELQSAVSDLKAVFSSALLELSHIKDSDTCLEEGLRRTRRTCETRTCHLEALLFSLKEELLEMRCQMLQLCCDQQKLQQSVKMSHMSRGLGPERNCFWSSCACREGRDPHYDFSQGGCAGRQHHTGAFVPQSMTELTSAVTAPCGSAVPHARPNEGRRMQAVLELLHSEQEYVKTLSQLHEKGKTLSAVQREQESQTKLSHYTERLLGQHRLFRNELEELLSTGCRVDRVAEAFATLTCQDDSTFSEMYLGYLRTIPEVISALQNSDVAVCNAQASLGDRKQLLEVFPLLAPVSRIHNYMIHTQSLLQWTRKEHPDYHLLEERKQAFWHLLSQCHELLENASLGDVKEEPGCSSACAKAPRSLNPSSCDTAVARETSDGAKQWNVCPYECHSARKSCSAGDSTHHLCVPQNFNKNPLFPATSSPDRKEGSGACEQGFLLRLKTSGEQACGQEPPDVRETVADGDTDQEDFGNTSVFDYSSVTSCSPDGTFELGAKVGEEGRCVPGHSTLSDGEADSQVPVLLKPSQRPSSPLEHAASGETSPCPRWQVPRVSQEHSLTKNLPLSPSRTFKITWDKSFQQDEFPSPNEYKKTGRQATSKVAQDRRYQRVALQASLLGVPRGDNTNGAVPWEESEDEGPCSTV